MAVTLNNKARLAGTSFLLFFLSVVLTAYSTKNPEVGQIGSSLILTVLKPVQGISNIVTGGVSGTWDRYLALVDLKRENEQVKERLSALEAENSRLLELEHENRRLGSLLGVKSQSGFTGVVASVIGYDASNWAETLLINIGQEHGVKPGMPVVEGNGLVGQVIAVGTGSSRVQVITDHGSGVDAIIQSSRARGVVGGLGGERAELKYVVREEEVKLGDRVITSGLDGVYPKGLFVGVVADLDRTGTKLFQVIEIKTAVRFSKLETVLVVSNTNPVDQELKRKKGKSE